MPVRTFEATKAWLIVAAIAITAVGLLILIGSAAFDSFGASDWDPAWRTFWEQVFVSIGASLIPVGIALFITEVLLKPVFTRELLSLVHLQQRVTSVGFQDLSAQVPGETPQLYETASTIDLALTYPETWLNTYLSPLLKCAHRPVTVNVYLPDPLGQASETMASEMGVDLAAYREQLSDFTRQVAARWKVETGVHKKATLDIHYISSALAGPIYRFDSTTIVGMLSGPSVGIRSWVYLHLRKGEVTDVQQWLDTTWNTIEASVVEPIGWTSSAPDKSELGVRKRLGAVDQSNEKAAK